MSIVRAVCKGQAQREGSGAASDLATEPTGVSDVDHGCDLDKDLGKLIKCHAFNCVITHQRLHCRCMPVKFHVLLNRPHLYVGI